MPWKPAHRQRLHERRALARADHAQPVGLVLVAGELGEELVVADPGAGGELRLGADALADQLGDARGRADAEQVLGHVEVGLVEAERLDVRGERAEDRANLLRDLLVHLEAVADEDQLGAQPPRGHPRHCRAHAELARLVARRRDHAARAPEPPTATGLPRRSGSSRCSTLAKNASMSTWMILRRPGAASARLVVVGRGGSRHGA
jgi:hypothetical protein